MKQKMEVLSVLAVCVLLLAGCGCRHEWTEADCDSPKMCSVCERTSGQALGHSWEDATCTAAKICSRCALVKGEALGHSVENGECVRCGATEADISFMGNWIGWFIHIPEFSSYPSGRYNAEDYYCTFNDDGTGTVTFGTETYTGTWKESEVYMDFGEYEFDFDSPEAKHTYGFYYKDDSNLQILTGDFAVCFKKRKNN